MTTRVLASTIQSVSNTAISGTITSDQIASLATTKLTGTITNSQLAGSITADKITSLATTQLTGTITNAQLAGSITADKITSLATTQLTGTISSGQLAAGAAVANIGYTPYNATNPNGYITGINSGNVITALGYTPYNATNPNGYTTNTGTVTAVATGNGLQGGTITTSGTLSLAAPGFNTVGSYVYAMVWLNQTGTQVNSGSTYSAGTSGFTGEIWSAVHVENLSLEGAAPRNQYSANLSGTWRWMAGNSNSSAGNPGNAVGLAVRVT